VPTLKERIENNLPLFFLSALVSGFVAGIGAYEGTLKITDHTTIANETLSKLKESAEKKGSPPNAEPIKHLIRSEPGDHPAATINLANSSGRDLDLVWIDSSGAEQQFKRIPTGGLHSVATFLNTPMAHKGRASRASVLLEPRGRDLQRSPLLRR
jgi:hypothetical protein